MIVVDVVLAAFFVFLLAVRLWDYSNRLDLANDDLEKSIAEINELKQRCDGHKELIEALSKSVRELNGVVEEAVKSKEPVSDDKPDMSALIGGWSVDDVRTEIDASHISTGTIDGKSLMNCELPNISESAREKIFELLGVKVPEPTHDESYVFTGRILTHNGKIVANHRQGNAFTDSEGRIYMRVGGKPNV